MEQTGVDEYRQHCKLQASTWKDKWSPKEFNHFIRVVSKDPLLSAWFPVIYPIGNPSPIESLRKKVNPLRERLAELKASHLLYASVLWESFEVVWLAHEKRRLGDKRGLDELIRESLPINHVEIRDEITVTYRVQKKLPVYPDSIHRHIIAKDIEVEAEHFFGVDPNASKKQWSAWADEYIYRFLTLPDAIGADKKDKRRIAYLHTDPLSLELTADDLFETCTGGWKLCLAWGPKYTPQLKKGCLALNRPVKVASSEIDYPGPWWHIVESKVDEHKDILCMLLETINSLSKCRDKKALGGFIITTFEHHYIDHIRTATRDQCLSADTPIVEDGDTITSIIPSEVLLTDFHFSLDLDTMFPSKVWNYIAWNFPEKNTVLANEVGRTAERVRQIKKEIRAEIEHKHFCAIYLPGPADEIKRTRALIQKNPWTPDFCSVCKSKHDIYCAVEVKGLGGVYLPGPAYRGKKAYNLVCKGCCTRKKV